MLVLAVALLGLSKAEPIYAASGHMVAKADAGSPLEQADDADDADAESDESLLEQSAPIDSLDDIEAAVIQIDVLSELTIAPDSEVLSSTVVNRGSGFLIDPSGLAVTSNSLLGGSRFVKVLVSGESLPRKAHVVGVSECQDIAIIDIQGDDLPYLDWYEGPIRFGLDIYAAGYLLDEDDGPPFGLFEGVVLNASASTPSRQIAARTVLQHSSNLNIGQTGGPLLDRTGLVLGMNYAPSNNRSFALSRDELVEAVEQIQDVDHLSGIGITSEPLYGNDGMATGLKVLTVIPNRPAEEVGIRPGDVLISIAGNSLVSTNPMGVYCLALSIVDSTNIVPVEVQREGTVGVLAGQINGQSLDSYFSFTDVIGKKYPEFVPAVSNSRTRRPGLVESVAESNVGFAPIRDQSNVLSIQVPVAWDEVETGEWMLNNRAVGVQIAASTDLEQFYYEQRSPGVFVATSLGLLNLMSREELIDQVSYSSQCDYVDRFSLPQGYLNGSYDIWENCNGGDQLTVVLVASPITREYVLLLQAYVESAEDLTTLDRAWSTFAVNVPTSNRKVPSFDPKSVGKNIDKIVDTDGLAYNFDFIENETISALLPDDWDDTKSNVWVVEDEEVGTIFDASPSLDDYYNTWTTPGVRIRSSSSLGGGTTPDELLDSFDYSQYCTAGRRLEHKHTIYGINYAGLYDMWFNCGEEQNWLAVMAVENDQTDQLLMVEFRNVELADAEAFRVLIDSMYFYNDELKQTYAARPSHQGTFNDYTVDFVEVTDDTGLISVSVPEEWKEVKTADWDVAELSGTALNISADLVQYSNSWSEPGIFMAVSSDTVDLSTERLLELFDFSDVCELQTQLDYDDQLFEGIYVQWTGCDDSSSDFIVLAAASRLNPDVMILLNISVPSVEADNEIVKNILHSFSVIDDELVLGPAAVAKPNTVDLGSQIAFAAADSQPNEPGTDSDSTAAPTRLPTLEPTQEPTLEPTQEPNSEPVQELEDAATRPVSTATLRATATLRSAAQSTPTPRLFAATPNSTSTPRAATPTVRPTATSTVRPTATSTVRPTATSTSRAVAASSGELLLPPPLAVVIVPSLNIRSGPGIEYAPLTIAVEGQQLQVIGEAGSCRWLQIVTEDGTAAWVSGIDTYVRFSTPCSVVQNFQFTQPVGSAPVANSIPTLAPALPNTPPAAPPTEPPAVAPTAVADVSENAETAIDNSEAAIDAGNRALLGCFVFQNPLSVAANITLTNLDSGQANTFEVPRRTDLERCFAPGNYTYTLDAPPPWESTNGEIKIGEGEQLIFQIRPEELE